MWNTTDPCCVIFLIKGSGGTSFNTDTGAGSDILCLHSQPRLDTSLATLANASRSTIYGIEYGFDRIPFSYENNCRQTFLGGDMPCAVCHVQTKTQQIMIPARDSCPTGWTLEYWGFLVSAGVSHRKLTYTCLNNTPESLTGSFADSLSRVIYPVETVCGASLPCPPYVAGIAVPCFVCAK